tara:strand:- start:568 stop:1470 length:903 start_codon:yes stop_codon:yes gene_type:complete
MNRLQCNKLASLIHSKASKNDIFKYVKELQDISHKNKKVKWLEALIKFETFLNNGTLVSKVFAIDGNGKLPFLSFSSLAGLPCVGAGDCLKFCYSFRAWRYPYPFFRQLQNYILLECEAGRDIIKSELEKSIAIVKRRNKLKNKEHSQIDFRLYVDGDFHSKQCLVFWMEQIKDNPILSTYGYSKSFGLFLNLHNEGFKFPINYVLNISSGSKYNQSIIDKMLKLPMVRDQFVAVTMPYKVTTDMHSNKEHQKRLREEYKKINPIKKVFACGGLCGECTNKKHACGDMRFLGVPILIGVH